MDESIYREVRANVAFEQMVLAVLFSALISGACLLTFNNVVLIAKGGWRIADGLMTALGAMHTAFYIFLCGFAGAILVGAPLFRALEKIRYRRIWPYAAAALAVQYLVLAVLQGRPPTLETPAGLLFVAPGLMAALLFGRFIRPLWAASARPGALTAVSPISERWH